MNNTQKQAADNAAGSTAENAVEKDCPEGATTYSAGTNTQPWTEVRIRVSAGDTDAAADIAQMTVPYGLYIEDYRDLEEETLAIAHIDLIDEALRNKDKTHSTVHIYLEPGQNPAEAVAFLRERYRAAGIENELELLPCRNEDWQNNWKKFFHPLRVGKKLLIQPVWEADGAEQALNAGEEEAAGADNNDASADSNDTGAGRAVLKIEPGLAFGTGQHDTTQLCMEALEEKVRPGMTVLDLGCGSGVLSIAALLLGAKSAEGVDIDALAAKTARANGALNGFSEPVYTVHCGNMADKVHGTFDIVVANIVADIIVPFCESARTFMRDGSVFIVSGIIDTRENDVLKAFSNNGFTIAERRQSKEWLCFIVK